MIRFSVTPEIGRLCPEVAIGVFEYRAEVQKTDAVLWEEMTRECITAGERYKLEGLAALPEIADCRAFYKKCGKDPSRYRVSSEALIRRILQGKGLYRVNSIVDFNNLISIRSLFSVCSYDMDQICGDIVFRIGKAGETFKGIRKDTINLEGLPVFIDDKGPFGSPTHDSERTMITENSRRIMTKIMSFSGHEKLKPVMDDSYSLLTDRLGAKNIISEIITVKEA